MKKLMALLLTVSMMFSLGACGNTQKTPVETDNTEAVEGSVDQLSTDMIAQLIMDMTDLELSSGCLVQEVTAEDAAYTLGYEKFNGNFESAHAIVPMMNINPFILVAFRLADDADAEAFAADLKSNANLGKWVCVRADQAEAKVSGHTVLFYMSPRDYVDPINAAFDEMCAPGFVAEDHIYNPLADVVSMEDMYAKLYEMFSVDNYGFMDNTDMAPVTADSAYGLNNLDTAMFTDSLLDDGYVAKSDEDEEKAYVLALFRIAEGVDVQAFIEAVQESLDTSSLQGGDVEVAINYSGDIVTVYAGTGTYGILATSFGIILTADYRMNAVTLQ